jgi:two-component system sensor histidine kinase DegS
LILFRVAQEALRNSQRHSQARKIQVRLYFQEKEAKIMVKDDGIGFKCPTSLGNFVRESKFGLIGMSERVHLHNGFFSVDSKLGSGTTIIATLPS